MPRTPILPPGSSPSLDALETAVTRRTRSLFADDVAERRGGLIEAIAGRRILVVGGGGSIGAVTVRLAADLRPAALHVVDQNENYLAELVRDLRGSPQGIDPRVEFRMLPVDYGSPIMRRFLSDAPPYDAVLNFAAMKHVRSEKERVFDVADVRHQHHQARAVQDLASRARAWRALLRRVDRQGWPTPRA